jgi:hypothetical protein
MDARLLMRPGVAVMAAAGDPGPRAPARAANAAILPLLRFVEWLFGPRFGAVDLGLMLIAAGWSGLLIGHPTLFDQASFRGLAWLADEVWTGLMLTLVGAHAVGIWRPRWAAVRIAAILLSSWAWIFVAISFARVQISTGVVTYALIGLGALCAAIHVASGSPRRSA